MLTHSHIIFSDWSQAGDSSDCDSSNEDGENSTDDERECLIWPLEPGTPPAGDDLTDDEVQVSCMDDIFWISS